MTDFTLQVHGYGHLGRVNYDQELGHWSFSRSTAAPDHLLLLTSPVCLHQGTEDSTGDLYVASSQVARYTALITKLSPEIIGVEELIKPDLITSWAISNSHHNYDAAIGNHLAFGSISYGGLGIQVYASVVGDSTSILRVSAMAGKNFGSAERTHKHLVPPAVESVTYWEEEHGPIQQIVFAVTKKNRKTKQSTGNRQKLAVRMAAKTVILKFSIDQYEDGADESRSENQGPWQNLSLEQVSEIPVEGDVNSEHADICFNPLNQTEIALIDRRGKWSIYEIVELNRALKSKVRPIPVHQSQIHLGKMVDVADETVTNTSLCRQDGWARIAWTMDAAFLAVCTRTRLQFFHLKMGKIVPVATTMPGETIWNLDMCVAGERSEHIFLLTSTRVLWIRLESHSTQGKVLELPMPSLSDSMRHFRDASDLTMQLKVVHFDADFLVFIFSRRNPIMTYFRIIDTSRLGGQVQTTDLATIVLPKSFDEEDSSKLGIIDIDLRSSADSSHTRETRSPAIHLTLLLSDRSLWQTMIVSESEYVDVNDINQTAFPGTSKLRQSQMILNSFVQADGNSMVHGKHISAAARTESATDYGRDIFVEDRMRRNEPNNKRRPFNMHPTYLQLADLQLGVSPISRLGQCFENLSDFGAIQLKLQSAHSVVEDPSITMIELIPQPFKVAEDDLRSSSMGDLSIFNALKSSSSQNLVLNELIFTLSFNALHEDLRLIKRHFVDNLPADVLPESRARKAEMAKVIAMELHMAACRAPRLQSHFQQPAASMAGSNTSGSSFSIAMHPTSLGKKRNLAGKNPLTAPPAKSSQQGTLTDVAELQAHVRNSTTTNILQKFALFSKPLPVRKPTTSRNLGHWTIGHDPSEYNFLDNWADEERLANLANMNAAERAALEKRELILKRRIEKQTQLYLASQQSDQIVTQTQRAAESQFQLGRDVPASQSLLKQALASQRQQETQQTFAGSEDLIKDVEMSGALSQPVAKKKKRRKGF